MDASNNRGLLVSQVGTTELILGLLAAVGEKLRGRTGSTPDVGTIPVRLLCNVLHQLKAESSDFRDELKYLDFRSAGDNSSSNTLERILFAGGTWGLHYVQNPALVAIAVPSSQARKRLQDFEANFGAVAKERLDQIAEEVTGRLCETCQVVA